jgi:integrase/recombinase XerD
MERSAHHLSLYARDGRRKYVTPSERARFIDIAADHPQRLVGTLGLILAHTGCRISEALALTCGNIERGECFIALRSLKKRGKLFVREIPVPPALIARLERRHDLAACDPQALLFPWSRGRAWFLVKSMMIDASIADGPHQTPKGLRHGFGIHALRSGVPINFVQRWLGHASLTTTAIYLDAIGEEEREIASRMWADPTPSVTSQNTIPITQIEGGEDACLHVRRSPLQHKESGNKPGFIHGVYPAATAYQHGSLPCCGCAFACAAPPPSGAVAVCDPPSLSSGLFVPMKPGAHARSSNKTETKMTDKQPKRPSHIVFQVIGDGEDAFWNRIGAAWANKDGKGFNIHLDAYPITGHTVMRENKEPLPGAAPTSGA